MPNLFGTVISGIFNLFRSPQSLSADSGSVVGTAAQPTTLPIVTGRQKRSRGFVTAGDGVYHNPDLQCYIHSYFSPYDNLTYLMGDPGFAVVLADIQRYALLPTRASAIELFWINNQDEIDLDVFKTNLKTLTNDEVEAMTDGLLGIAKRFLSLRRELVANMVGGSLRGRAFREGVLERCFKAVALLASANVRVLHLEHIGVHDLTPLASLTSLTHLYVGENTVNPTPLAHLVTLEVLHLVRTPVQDLTTLAHLVNLEGLSLFGTLVNLKWLDLQRTQVENLTPLAHLDNLRSLFLRSTRVVDLTPLALLVNLRTLGLEGTRTNHRQLKHLVAGGLSIDG